MRPPLVSSTVAGPGTSGLADRVVSGIGWNAASQVVLQLTRVLVGVVLARLLSPHQFGLAGMALVFSGLVAAFTDLSLGAALVQRQTVTERDRSTVFWATVGLGALATLVGVAVSVPVARFFGEPQVARLLAALSVTFVVTATTIAHTALLTREMRYRTLQVCATIGAVLGGVVAVGAAAAGLGAWAIIAQAIAAAVVTSILTWIVSPWTPQRVFSVGSLRDVGGFGIKLFASRLLAYANLNVDNMLIGRFVGAGALGVYALAYNVMFTPMVRIGLPIQQVLVPAYSRLQDEPERLASAWLRSKRLSAALLAPAFLGMAVVAPDLVPVVFGAKWHRAVHVLELLCLAGVAHSLVTLNWSALQARGRAGTLLRLNLFVSAVTLAAFAIGLHWGIVGVAASFAVAKWLLVVPDTWITCRGMAVRTWEGIRSGAGILPLALTMAAAAGAFRLLLVAIGVGAAPRLVLVIAAGTVAYLALARVTKPALVDEFRRLLRRPATAV
jgi:O-antigen/teichoic acid export membrane protein